MTEQNTRPSAIDCSESNVGIRSKKRHSYSNSLSLKKTPSPEIDKESTTSKVAQFCNRSFNAFRNALGKKVRPGANHFKALDPSFMQARGPKSAPLHTLRRSMSIDSTERTRCSIDRPRSATNTPIKMPVSEGVRLEKMTALLEQPIVDLNALRKLAWNGIPVQLRGKVWKLLLGYMPSNAVRRDDTLVRKRNEYNETANSLFVTGNETLDASLKHQIHIDVERTHPTLKLFQQPVVRGMLERILYVWSIRHPASGYVQGISDLTTPFLFVFLNSMNEINEDTSDIENRVSKEDLLTVEADTYWCLSKLLDGIQDNYIQSQPGIYRQVMKLQELTQRIDVDLINHFNAQGIEFMQFSFRWMNCLLMREFALRHIIRMWDTYIAEGLTGVSDFHVYVCVSLLIKWSEQLQTMDFQDCIIFLQSPPTRNWSDSEVEVLLSEAYLWKYLFSDACAHLK
ncbi:GTPase-activating protein gyp1 [Schizosaccharomyces japonicus yFS275]|uniref:GTPase-activating protein gyp1 n=1 Tax=Schizosaccharomyces japonicus (strain yFS275 / FY16936) TaxID=402676 RepID=B6K0V1_SCHJY|nr:GTPase-activating protein gyp1 [Schizosaccharomyces japonicus yFS275]EEB07572.1 GTPase-activating protein gyp1 [Schizosaccharomyces japonicus yFS275]